jgi:hypothetical protein
MSGSTFQTHPEDLYKLLERCHNGELQLPDFQRSWVWDEDRIKSLVASVSRAFPVGALMTLNTGGPVNFKPRPVEGAPPAAYTRTPQALLLDGQQRMTSLYQVTLRGTVVDTVTPRGRKVRRWFYLDIRKAMDPLADREEAVIGVPEDRVIRTNFNQDIVLDLSTPEKEFEQLLFPLTSVFAWEDWQDGFNDFWTGNEAVRQELKEFRKAILENFKYYRVPVIALDNSNSKQAVCTVFEKVNTGGKALDAFELVTAMYAAEGHELRKDWLGDATMHGREHRFQEWLRPAGEKRGIIADVSNTDFLQAVSLFYTRDRRREAEAAGKSGKELPAISGNRDALLNLPLAAYKLYEAWVEEGFKKAAQFLHLLHIYRIADLPYQSQLVPLAAILAELGSAANLDATRNKLVRWYWNGVFGELYGSTVETRIAKDFIEVPLWLKGGKEPSTISDTLFRPDRLKTMRTRLSAAYKGVNALLMKEGVQDLRSGQKFDQMVFFGENVDIHHIFPQKWCKDHQIPQAVYDSIINKTPLSAETNRILGGVAPQKYLAQLELKSGYAPAAARERLDSFLVTHLIDPELLRSDDFPKFMQARQAKLITLIESAMGKPAYAGHAAEEGEESEYSEEFEIVGVV